MFFPRWFLFHHLSSKFCITFGWVKTGNWDVGSSGKQWWTIIDNGPLLQEGRTYLAVWWSLLNCEHILYLSGDIILQWFVVSAFSRLEKKVGYLSGKYLFDKVEAQMLKLRLLPLSGVFFQWNCLERGRQTLQVRYQSHCHSVTGICYSSDFKQDLHWGICQEMTRSHLSVRWGWDSFRV